MPSTFQGLCSDLQHSNALCLTLPHLFNICLVRVEDLDGCDWFACCWTDDKNICYSICVRDLPLHHRVTLVEQNIVFGHKALFTIARGALFNGKRTHVQILCNPVLCLVVLQCFAAVFMGALSLVRVAVVCKVPYAFLATAYKDVLLAVDA